MKRFLIAGGNGQLAQALHLSVPPEFECTLATREVVDITDAAAVRAALGRHQPAAVINGAAYNLVDAAEGDGMAAAVAINVHGVATLTHACRDAGIPLVHFSTDFVFDGRKLMPYVEEDATGPISTYGATKLAGENIALLGSDRNLVIRVCRLFGPAVEPAAGSNRKPAGNFPLLMIRLGRERESLRVVSDQIGTPSYTPDLARGVWQLLQAGATGLFQVSNEGEVSFDDYAREVFRQAGVSCQVESVTSAEYAAPARRPAYSVMSNRKAIAAGMLPLRDWREALGEFLEFNRKDAKAQRK